MSNRPVNGFIQSLPPASWERLRASLKPVALEHAKSIGHIGEPVEWVYFPVSCLISMISMTSGGQGVETAMAGNEGAAGLIEACGSGVSNLHSVVQVDGRAWRSPAAVCRAQAFSDPDFAASAWRLAELQLFESRQSGLCQSMHSVEARYCRWLLESCERTFGRNPLPLTQEFTAAMLGVQRTTVSAFASQLQKEGLIAYARGQITMVDEAGVARRACECRRVVQDERARLGLFAEAPSQPERACA